jgi:protease I
MQDKPLARRRAAILVANGFMESDMTAVQRALAGAGAIVRTVSTENGLVNSWQGTGWGYNFAVDVPLSKALAAEYDILVVPSGARSMDKLKLTAHTKRFIGGFLAAGKPALLLGESVALLAYFNMAEGREIASPDRYVAELEAVGATPVGKDMVRSQSLVTGNVESDEQLQAVLSVFIDGVKDDAYNMSAAA